MKEGLLVAFTLAGCADFAGIGDPKPIAPDAPPAPCMFGDVDLCLYAFPQNDLVIAAPLTLNTDRDCDLVYNKPIGRSACVLYARTIAINADLNAIGSRPLILAATDHIEVNAAVGVSGLYYFGLVPGAAANDRDCVGNMLDAAGEGGSFGGKGGAGGLDAASVRASSAPAIPVPPYLRGGCPGGGGGKNGDSEGNARNSGGAVALVAGGTVVVGPGGQVLANGAGGPGATTQDQAAGGGSGGMIRIAAQAITIEGIVAANGGGGGEGLDGITNGSQGADGTPTMTRAAGGTGHPGGEDGGAGGAGSTPEGLAGMNAASVAADGAGGGGAGFVVVTGALSSTGTISPEPIVQ